MSSLLRSTKFVRYFTGAARTILLNTAKTAETNLLINSKALCAANNVLMRDYATKKAESLEPLLLKLDSEVRRYGRISKKDIDDVFDEIRSRNDITSSQSLLVIRCCGELVPEELPEQRTLLVQKIWTVLTERGIPMDISHYNALLRVYLENEHPFSPAQFLEELETKGLQPNRVTYQRLMWRYCQEGDVEGATKVLEKMRELNFPVSEPVLNALVMGHAFHGDTDGAKAVIETMARAGLQPTNRTYTLLACGYARKGDVDGVNEVIKQATEKDTIIIDKDVLEIIEHLALSGYGDKVEQLFPHLKKSFGYNQEVCNLILKLLNKGNLDIAKKMLTTMPKNIQAEDTRFKGAFFIKQLVRVGKTTDEILKTCLELKNEGLIPNSIYMATEQSLILGRTELAEKLFTELEKEGHEIRPHYYWPLLAQKVKENDEEGLLQLIKNMQQKNVNISGEALRDYVIPYLKKKDPKSIITKLQLANVPVAHTARNLIIDMLERGEISEAANLALQYKTRGNFSLMKSPLLYALSKTKDVNSFVNILHVLSSKQPNQTEENDDGQQQDTDLNEISKIIISGVKIVSRDQLALNLLTLLHSKGLRISTQAAENIEQYLGENMTTQISELLTKLTSTELETAPLGSPKRDSPRNSAELEKLIATLKTKEGTNVNRLQKQLLNTYIMENNVEKVVSYIEELKSSNFEITTPTYAQLFEFYCENGQIEKAKECQAQILAKDPDYAMNKFKIIAMATALVKANRFDEAIQYLKETKLSGDIELSFMYNAKCWQLLNTLVEQKDPAKVKQMTNTLIELELIKPTNVLLGPLIKVHINNNDLEGALNEFEHCCKQYRSTPWKGELMKALIMKEDAAKLQWLADLSTQIHGEVNILHDLVLAFVECGRLRQARRILGTPGLQTRHRRLEEACLRYVEEGKSEYLEGLLEATKELSNIDRANIFFHLLVTYCKANETEKALGLWTLLQEEGEVPSDQFLSYLGQHLKEKKQPVPFIIPKINSEIKPKTEKKVQPVTEKVKKEAVTNNQVSQEIKNHTSSKIEALIQNGQLSKAKEDVIKSINDGNMPKSNVIKYLLKNLALEGNVESIEEIGKHLKEEMKRRVTFDDKLTAAKFVNGGGDKHIDELVKSTDAAKSDEDFVNVIRKFPRSQTLASIVNNEDLLAKCTSVAEKAASKGYFTAVNLLWMELILSNKTQKADELFNKYLINAPVIIFRRLLQESHTRKQPELIEKLIEDLKKNKLVSLNSLGNAYSRLISHYITENQIEKAEKSLESAISIGLGTENINKSCLYKLKHEVEELGKSFKYEIK